MVRWLEITADYRCNNRCVGCYAVQDAGPSMDGREVLTALDQGRREGARALWLGGGEPTLRRDLLATVRAARRMGYDRIKLQTNGLLLAYPDYAQRCADAGVTEVAFALKGATAATHDRLTQTPGGYALLAAGIAAARALGLALEGDVLVYRDNAHELPALVRHYTAAGLGHYRVWLLHVRAGDDPALVAQVPRIADVIPHLTAAMDLGLSTRADFITSLHTPPCTVPATHHGCLFHAADLGLLVTNPGGQSFRLEESPMEGGYYPDGCRSCAFRARCGGARRDYVTLHGEGEFRPLRLLQVDANPASEDLDGVHPKAGRT